MRLPFFRKAVLPDTKEIGIPHAYKPSPFLQLIVHLPANGLVHLQPPLDAEHPMDRPGEYDHILSGDLEVIAPATWGDRVESISVGLQALSKLNLGVGREGEVDVLFERWIALSEDADIVAGSQRFAFNLIVPSTLPVHDRYETNAISHRIYSRLVAVSSEPPAETSTPLDPFRRDITPSPTHVSISYEAGTTRVTYGSDTRLRLTHMTERDAGHVTLNLELQGLAEGLGVYEIKLISDIWTIAAPFHFSIRLPSLSPLLTVFSVCLSILQTPSIRSPRDVPGTAPQTSTMKLVLAEFGAKVPAGHWHPGTNRPALWQGSGADGHDGGDGWAGEIRARLPEDRILRASTVPGITTPIHVQHAIRVDVYYSVYGQFADGKAMRPKGPGELRQLRITQGIMLPSCTNVPDILHLPTYAESSTDLGKWRCACALPEVEVMSRLEKHIDDLGRAELEREEHAAAKDKHHRR